MKLSLSLCVVLLIAISFVDSFSNLFPSNGFCGLSPKEKRAALSSINRVVTDRLQVPECGPGLWLPVADLDVTGQDTTCPPGWTFLSTPRIGCTRPPSGSGGCGVASFSSRGCDYDRVCGRITGRASGLPNGFLTAFLTVQGMVDGVTITYANPAKHIWTFSVGGAIGLGPQSTECPCNVDFDDSSFSFDPDAVAFAGDNYFCDDSRFSTDPLWTSVCTDIPDACCALNPRPYFNASLDSPTIDDIDVRICTGQGAANEQVFVESMQLFTQLS